MNAAAMIDRCFEHQHSEEFGRVVVPYEFPVESNTSAETAPEGTGAITYIPPEVLDRDPLSDPMHGLEP